MYVMYLLRTDPPATEVPVRTNSANACPKSSIHLFVLPLRYLPKGGTLGNDAGWRTASWSVSVHAQAPSKC